MNKLEKTILGALFGGMALSFLYAWYNVVTTGCIDESWGYGGKLCGVSAWGVVIGLTLCLVLAGWSYWKKRSSGQKE